METPARRALWITCLLGVGIAGVTLLPVSSPGPAGTDKLYHAIAFALLTLPMTTVRPRLVIWIVLCAVLYGGLIEWAQPWVGRTREAADLVADGLGAIAGGLCGYMLSDRFKR